MVPDQPTWLQKYAKLATSFLVFAFAAVALFWGGEIFGFQIDADFQSKVEALIPLLAGVVAVGFVKNATPDDWSKAAAQLITGSLAVVTFFHSVPASLGVQIGAFVYAFVIAVYGVWRSTNHPSTVG